MNSPKREGTRAHESYCNLETRFFRADFNSPKGGQVQAVIFPGKDHTFSSRTRRPPRSSLSFLSLS